MESAKEAVQHFMSKSGHHDTTVDERVRPAVVEEQVQPIRREVVTTAIDKEIHQDHYHTTIQPLKDREVLPEKHEHHILPVEQRSFDHEDKERTRASLDAVTAKFHDTKITRETQHVTAALPTVTGEHVHHHVHETVQPVIYKETIVPHVVHTTIPIHEVHHAAVQHHGVSTLPAIPISDFIASGGSIKGHQKADSGHYEGPPRPYNKDLQTGVLDGDRHPHRSKRHSTSSSSASSLSDAGHTPHSASTNTTTTPHDPRRDSSLRTKLDHILHPSKSKSKSRSASQSSSSHHGPLAGTAVNPDPDYTHNHATPGTAGAGYPAGKVGPNMDHIGAGGTGVDRKASAAGTGMSGQQRDEKKGGFPYMNVLK